MPSFQSPLPMSGRPCAPDGEAALDRAHAVLEERCRLGRTSRADRRLSCSVGASGAPSRNGTRSSRTAGRRCRRGSAATAYGSQSRSSEQRVRMPRPLGRMPPVLHVAFDELPAAARSRCSRSRSGRANASAITSWSWSRKPIGAAGLVEAACGPRAGSSASGRAASGSSSGRTSRPASAPGRRRASAPRPRRRPAAPLRRAATIAVAAEQRARLVDRSPWPSRKHDAGASRPAPARRSPAARRTGRGRRRSGRQLARASAAGRASEPLRPRNSAVAGADRRGSLARRTRRGRRTPCCTGCARGRRRSPRRDSVTTCAAARARRAEHPLVVAEHAQAPGAPRRVVERQHRRTSPGRSATRTRRARWRRSRRACAKRVTPAAWRINPRGLLGASRAADPAWRPRLAALLVAQEDRLRRRVGDRVVGERRQAVLAAVLRPGEDGAGRRDDRAEARVRDHVRPRQRRLVRRRRARPRTRGRPR